MAEKVNFMDIAIPAIAFLASAYSPQGAVAAQALTGALQLGERRRSGRREDKRLEELMGLRRQETQARSQALQQRAAQEQQEFEAGRPQRELQAEQLDFQRENLQDIQGLVGASVPSQEAVQALGAPQVARLQEALGRGEQAPLPMEAPSPQMRQQRLQELARTPGGAAQLTAAGLGDVATATAPMDQRAMEERVRMDRQAMEERARLTKTKETALADLRGYTPDDLEPELRERLSADIVAAQTPDELLATLGEFPSASLKPKSARIEEYKFYADYERQQGRQPLGPLEYETAQRKASANRIKTVTNVGPQGIDYGDPPKDTAWARNPDGSVLLEPYGEGGQLAPVAIPVRGGQAYREIAEGVEKKELAQEQVKQAAGITVDTINRAVTNIEDSPYPITGAIGTALSYIPGSNAFNLSSQLDTIRSNIGFEALQKMRQSSPTGGALGPVSDTENRLLQSVLGSLRQGQDDDELKSNMNRIREIYLDVLHGVNRPNRQMQYLTQEDIATLNEAQQAATAQGGDMPDPAQLTPQDLSRLTPEQLDALERQLSGGQR